MREAFMLAWRTLLRGRFLPLLIIGAAAVVFLMPNLIRTDGTASGARELYVHSVLGCVAALVFLSVLCASCGHLARSREAHRLSLALIRPICAFQAIAGVWCAYVAAAAIALSAAAIAVYARAPGGDVPCRHHIAPELPSPIAVAMDSIDGFLAKPSTPDAMRKAPRKAVLAYLAAAETDRFDPIKPGDVASWNFPSQWASATNLSLRVRFATQFAVRSSFAGEFSFGASCAVISNCTQSVIEQPLIVQGSAITNGATARSTIPAFFKNTGTETVMLRPRKDLFLLSPADTFGANLFRAMMHVLSGVALASAFGLFLSATLSRPVAVFTAFVSIAVIFIAPNVIDQFPDGVGLPLGDRIGLALSRGVYAATYSLSDASPIADLAEDRCVEWPALAHAVLFNAILLPLSFLGCAAFAIRRKTLPDHG